MRQDIEFPAVSVDDAIAFLNSLLELDRGAISVLVSSRTICNSSLANHPAVQVVSMGEGGAYLVGFLGILNGMFGVCPDGLARIVALVDGDTDRIIRFARTEEALEEVPCGKT